MPVKAYFQNSEVFQMKLVVDVLSVQKLPTAEYIKPANKGTVKILNTAGCGYCHEAIAGCVKNISMAIAMT